MPQMKYLIWLTCKLGFSSSANKYLEKFTAEEIYRMNWDTLVDNGLPDSLASKSLERAERIMKICEAKGIEIMPCPEILRKFKNMPAVIYAKGDIDTLKDGLRVGIVGTRKASEQGRVLTGRLAGALASENCVIISGGAAGIDTVALATAVRLGKRCVAVLGCDIDCYYPAENYSLLTLIAEHGAVISEYPPETNARYFPSRNRILATLCERVVVTEAPEKSGALITAQYASDYGIPVFSCSPSGESFKGSRELIERGAYTFSDAKSIMENSRAVRLAPVTKDKKAEPEKNENEKSSVKKYGIPIYDHIIDCILSGRDTTSSMLDGEYPIQKILQTLTALELEGVIVSLPGDRYKVLEI